MKLHQELKRLIQFAEENNYSVSHYGTKKIEIVSNTMYARIEHDEVNQFRFTFYLDRGFTEGDLNRTKAKMIKRDSEELTWEEYIDEQ